MDKMKALVLVEPGKTEIREIDKPVDGANEVLLQVSWVGFCGGDLNGYRGLFELQEYPNVLGHEVGATIVETGADVPETLRPGMQTRTSTVAFVYPAGRAEPTPVRITKRWAFGGREP